MKFVLASHNRGKLKEMQEILGTLGVEVVLQSDLGLDLEPEGDRVYGYEREEMTHNAVAVQIAGGSADAGMGICSAARLYDLDFLPICVEEYDLLIPENVWNSALVKQLIRTLKSKAFRERIEAMGGYTLDRPGEIIEVF